MRELPYIVALMAMAACSVPGVVFQDCPSMAGTTLQTGDRSSMCVGKPLADAGVNGPPDAGNCYGTGIVKLCLASAPSKSWTLVNVTPVNTDSDARCEDPVGSPGNCCVIAATSITIQKNATLQATGSKPLVLVATDAIQTMAGGTIDVRSRRGAAAGAGADPMVGCTTDAAPSTSNGSGGGGAGGSFAGVGGTGGFANGNGDTGGVPGRAAGLVTTLRGGCRGQAGAGAGMLVGGHGGGAVFLIAANAITVAGSILAGGEGGDGGTPNAGGSGGGAGGMIGFDAPSITLTGMLAANGGGGGEGGGSVNPGMSGADSTTTAAAPGGINATTNGGGGGDGAAGEMAGAGVDGQGGILAPSTGGGGGGGGGAGVIAVPVMANLGGAISPPVSR
jgi:hypothetical protein